MGITAHLSPLPREEHFYHNPDPAAWSDRHRRRAYRRDRINRHAEYLRSLCWSRSLLGSDLRQRVDASRSPAEAAWLLYDELTRSFSHRIPYYGLCQCSPFPSS